MHYKAVARNGIETGQVPELVAAIDEYIRDHNKTPRPFIWTAKASDILEKVTRARRALHKAASE